MAQANFIFSLNGGDFDGGGQRFAPGDTLQGSVQLVPEGNIKANHVWVRLQWHTEGRGDRDQGRVAELDVFQGTLTAQTPYTFGFSFVLPPEPWSYAGHYINIIWEVVAEIDIPLAFDVRQSQSFILAPAAQTRAPRAP
jgi:hypothetical protein